MPHFVIAFTGILQTSVVFFLVLSVLVLIHELGHFFVAKKIGVKVEEFGLGLPPRLRGWKFGETLYSLNWLPFGGFVKLFGEEANELKGLALTTDQKAHSFAHKHPFKKLLVVVAGVFMNFLLGWFLLSIVIFNEGVPREMGRVRVEAIQFDSPASKIGLKKGDEILKVKDEGGELIIQKSQDLIDFSKKNGDKEVILFVTRDGKTTEVKITPRLNPPAGQGSLGLNITSTSVVKLSVFEVPKESFLTSVKISVMIFSEFGKMIAGVVTSGKVSGQVAGPVKIAQMTGEAARGGWIELFYFMAMLSLNLSVINILPFPALDGGRGIFIMYELITKKKPKADWEAKINIVGFLFLISLIILVTVFDIISFIPR